MYETVWAGAYAAKGNHVQSFSLLFCHFCQSGWCVKIADFVIEGLFFFFFFSSFPITRPYSIFILRAKHFYL